MNQISHLLIQRVTSQLTADMQTSVARSDPSRAVTVKAYRFQDDPLNQNIYLYSTGGDPSDPKLRDARISARDMEDLQMKIPVGEVGGGHYWWRRYRTVIGCYFIMQKFTQERAGEVAHTVLGRAMDSIERTLVADLVDDFGEQAFMITVYASTFFEGGGPTDQYLWRGEIYWQVLTHRPL